MLKEVGIKHVHTSPYNSKSNGGCERGIRSLKDCLKRDKFKKVTQQVLDELTYNINSHPQDESGSAAERVFRKISQKLSFQDKHRCINLIEKQMRRGMM